MLNSRYMSVRYGHSMNATAATRAAARSRVNRMVTAYIAQPDNAQNRISVTL